MSPLGPRSRRRPAAGPAQSTTMAKIANDTPRAADSAPLEMEFEIAALDRVRCAIEPSDNNAIDLHFVAAR